MSNKRKACLCRRLKRSGVVHADGSVEMECRDCGRIVKYKRPWNWGRNPGGRPLGVQEVKGA